MLENLNKQKLLRELSVRDNALVKPRGCIIELVLNPQVTKFNVNDYIKQSKKSRRSEKLETKEKPLLQYSMVGKCIYFRKKGLSSSFTIRNVLSLSAFEIHYAFFTILIDAYIVREFFKPNSRIHYKRTHQYYLRKLSPVRSLIDFEYVTDIIDHYNDNQL